MTTPSIELHDMSSEQIERVRVFADEVRKSEINDQPVAEPPILSAASTPVAELSKEERLRRFLEWAGSWNPGVAVSVDREELYGGER